jgi:hypothetical protein
MKRARGFLKQVTASTGVQTCLGLGGLLGTYLGGRWGQQAYNADRARMPLFMGSAAILGTLPFWLLLNLPGGELGLRDGPADGNDGPTSSSSSSSSSSSRGALGGDASWGLLLAYVATAFVTGVAICMVGRVLFLFVLRAR